MNMETTVGDDLTRIKGIGPAYRDALVTSGIRRFADLAHLASPEDLQQLLEERADVSVPLWKIVENDWLGQAQALSEQTGNAGETSQRWRQHAGFSVFFDRQEDEDDGEQEVWQTRTYHDESGQEHVFAGVDAAEWAAWIERVAGLPVAPEAGELVFVTEEQSVQDVEIVAVDVAERQPTFGVFQGKLAATVRFRVSDEALVDAGHPFRLEIYLAPVDDGAAGRVAAVEGQLQAGSSLQSARADFSFPDPGRYRLTSVLFLLPPANRMALHDQHELQFVS